MMPVACSRSPMSCTSAGRTAASSSGPGVTWEMCRAASAYGWSAGLRPSRTACSWPSAMHPAAGARITYEETARAANAIAQSLLDRGLGPDRPVMILAENGIDHGADDAGRHARRRARGSGVDGLRAAEPGLRQAALHLRSGAAGPDLRGRGGPLRQGAGDDRGDAHRGRRQPRQPRRDASDAVLDADGGAADARRRCCVCQGRAGLRLPRSCSRRARRASPRA